MTAEVTIMHQAGTPAPEATLITGPAGSGKTEAVLRAIWEERDLSAFSTIWALLATREQVNAFHQRLLAGSPGGVQFGVELFTFERLYERLLGLLGWPQHQLPAAAIYRLLRHVIDSLDEVGALAYYGPIAQTPGFVGLVASLIHELKQSLVMPEAFAAAAERRGPKDRDLACIYSAYQQFLQQHDLADRHGAGWLALELLRREGAPPLPARLLVVDGFDQFNAVHVELLTALARRLPRTVLSLTDAPPLPGRRFRRFEQTQDRLWRAAPDLWRHERLEQPASPRTALAHLTRAVFCRRAGHVPCDGTLHLIESPDREREVAAVLRHVKRLLLGGVEPEAVLIIARHLEHYGAALRATAHAYGIPLVVRQGLPLAANPAVALLLELVDLAARDFPRRELIDSLRSPYLRLPFLPPDAARLLECVSSAFQVVRGQADWAEAIDGAAQAVRSGHEEGAPLLAEDEAGALREGWARLVAYLSPPAAGPARALAAWIDAIIGPDPAAAAQDALDAAAPEACGAASCGLLACIRAGTDEARVARDVMAVLELKAVLAGVCAAHDLLGAPPISWAQFRAELQLAIEGAVILPPGGLGRAGRVLATTVMEARGLPHDHVFILGLQEGEFPAPEPDELVYGEVERQQLAAAALELLDPSERADEMSLFYQAIGAARRTLTLSRITVDDGGAPHPASPYWQAVLDSVAVPAGAVERLRPGSTPPLADCATRHEVALAVAARFSAGAHDLSEASAVHNALLDEWGTGWRTVLRGRRVEARREDHTPFDAYSGLLADPAQVRVVADACGGGRLWSASQLNELGQCGFRFLARRLLGLEALREPAEGMDVLQFGTLHHAILERVYRRCAAEALAVIPENRARAEAILAEEAEHELADAPRRYGFRASPLWWAERLGILRTLGAAIAADFDEASPVDKALGAPAEARVPLLTEAAFGMGGVPAVVLDGPAGPLQVRGVIDRIDRVDGGAVVIDYKTGSTRRCDDDLAAGHEVQMLVYLRAAQQLLSGEPLKVLGGLYWHLRDGKPSGAVWADDPALDDGCAALHDHILAARRGCFPTRPAKTLHGRCAYACEFSQMCRFHRAHLDKELAD